MLRITITVPGGEKVDVALSRFGEFARDLSSYWAGPFATQFYTDVQANFDRRGGYVGGWPPLSPKYAAWKARRFPGKPLMEREDFLRNSLRGPRAKFAVFRPTRTGLTIGTSRKGASAHQLGKGRLPQRRILWLASSQTYGRTLHAWAVDRSRAAGLKAS